MGFFGSLFHGVVGAVTGLVTGGPVGAVIGGIGGLASGGSSSGNSAAGGIVNGIKNLITGGGGGIANSIESIISGISGTINDVSKEVASVIAPVNQVLHSVSRLAQQFNDQLIAPIEADIHATQSAGKALITALHGDLGHGLAGLAKVPEAISNALTSVDAQFSRSQQELGTLQTRNITEYIQPALVDSIGGPLQSTADTLATDPFSADVQAAYQKTIGLDEKTGAEALEGLASAFDDAMTDPKGLFSPLIKFFWGTLKMGDVVVAKLEQQIELIKQSAREHTPATLLSAGEAVEAYRRGAIDKKDFQLEMLRQGLSIERQNVLWENAQFLFGPRDAVDLRARDIIDEKTLKTLMDQNNLDDGQIEAITELMMHILGPGDIAAAKARGLITPKVFDAFVSAARVQTDLMPVIEKLEQTLVDPKLLVGMQGRATALQAGFLSETLNSSPPTEIAQQFDRTQAEAGTADLIWQAHWRIPNPEWWVDAYFRGLRTRTEVEAAFAAANVPPEIYDDIFAVEEELPPVWLIPDIIASGVWSKEQAIPQFRKLGFSADNAEVLYQYGFSKSKASKAETAADLQKVSLSNAATMFDDGLITSGEYTQILIDHGYSQDAADLTVQLTEFKEALKQRKTIAQEIVDEANLGEIDDTQAQDQLYALGYTQGEVSKWLLKLKATKKAKAKLPSRSDLDKMLKKGLIDNNTYLQVLQADGYSLYWAERYMALA